MRAPTIPNKEFLELAGSVKESASDKKFSWKELTRQKDYYAVLDYLSNTNVKYINEGSARVSFYLPTAIDGDGNEINAPCCLKVASNEDGVIQNKSDIVAFQKFGKKFDCFPRLYSYDEYNFYYFLCELATPAVDKYFKETIDSEKYFSKLKIYIHKDKLSPLTTVSLTKIRDLSFYIDALFDSYDIVYQPYEERTDLSKEEIKKFKKEWVAFWSYVKKSVPKYSGISDVCLGFIMKKFYDSDIDHQDNWGYVKRNQNLVLLPIDFGIGES